MASKNFGCDDRWTAMSLPSPQRNAKDCEAATLVSRSLLIPARV